MNIKRALVIFLVFLLLVVVAFFATNPLRKDANFNEYRLVPSSYEETDRFHLSAPFLVWVGQMEADEWIVIRSGWFYSLGDGTPMGLGKKCSVFALHGPTDRAYIFLSTSSYIFTFESDNSVLKGFAFTESKDYAVDRFREEKKCAQGIEVVTVEP